MGGSRFANPRTPRWIKRKFLGGASSGNSSSIESKKRRGGVKEVQIERRKRKNEAVVRKELPGNKIRGTWAKGLDRESFSPKNAAAVRKGLPGGCT